MPSAVWGHKMQTECSVRLPGVGLLLGVIPPEKQQANRTLPNPVAVANSGPGSGMCKGQQRVSPQAQTPGDSLPGPVQAAHRSLRLLLGLRTFCQCLVSPYRQSSGATLECGSCSRCSINAGPICRSQWLWQWWEAGASAAGSEAWDCGAGCGVQSPGSTQLPSSVPWGQSLSLSWFLCW